MMRTEEITGLQPDECFSNKTPELVTLTDNYTQTNGEPTMKIERDVWDESNNKQNTSNGNLMKLTAEESMHTDFQKVAQYPSTPRKLGSE